MLRKQHGAIEWLEFDQFQDFKRLSHRLYLRHGGVSVGNYGTLNFSFKGGDNDTHVEQNYNLIKELSPKSNKIVRAAQCHSARLAKVTDSSPEVEFSCDGLYTLAQQAMLMILHADCQAAIFYDPIRHVLANIHCGWRGNVQNIYREAIFALKRDFGTKPEDLLVSISPSLGPEQAEFTNYRTELPEEFWQFQVKPYYFDLWAISRWQLEKEGILPHHIEIAQICTKSNPSDYFSYRNVKQSGRHATCAMLL